MEVWKDVKGFECLYQVSNHGRVRSYTRIQENGLGRIYRSRIISQVLTKWGYYRVHLCKEGKSYHKPVHRLVAEAFLENPQNHPAVNHKDEVKINNHADNLEWCTYSYNNSYGTRGERISKALKSSKYINGKKRKVYQFTLDGSLVEIYPSSVEAAESIGVLQGSVRNACRNHYTLHGYVWLHENTFVPPRKRGNYKINKERLQSVAQYDKDKNLIKVYDSVTDAQVATGYDRHKIAKCCKGQKPYFHDFIWEYYPSLI